ncbi:MAG TPA: hypothetical protein DCE22_07205 [Verrucomicrobiales bacterium]|nr:hypothetical protein [Verrucomicrobiales bacterium]
MKTREGIELQKGSLIRHHKFGVGLVLSVDKTKNPQMAEIDFGSEACRRCPHGESPHLMSENILRKTQFEEGFDSRGSSNVTHSTFGFGRIISAEAGNILKIEFQKVGEKLFDPRLAKRYLTSVPENGLQDFLANDPDSLKDMDVKAPLQLLAMALTDHYGEATVSDLKDSIRNSGILSRSWEPWWRSVEVMVGTSPAFLTEKPDSVKLEYDFSKVENLALIEDPGSPKRPAKSEISFPQILESLSRGTLSLDSVSAAQIRKACRELLAEGKSEFLRAYEPCDWLVSVTGTRAVLDELSRHKSASYWLEHMLLVTNELRHSLTDPGFRQTRSGWGKWVEARSNLLENSMGKAPGPFNDDEIRTAEELCEAICRLYVNLSAEAISDWTINAKNALVRSLANATEAQNLFASSISSATSHYDNRDARPHIAEMISSYMELLEDTLKFLTMRVLLTHGGGLGLEKVWAYLDRTHSDPQIIEYLSNELSMNGSEPSSDLIIALAEISTFLAERITDDDSQSLLKIQILLSLNGIELPQRFEETLVENLSHVITVGPGLDESSRAGNFPGLLQRAVGQITGNMEEKRSRELSKTNKELSKLRDDLATSKNKREKAESLNKQLGASALLPEAIAESRGQLKVLSELAFYYQELFVGMEKSSGDSSIRATINQLESIFANFGIRKVGEIGSKVTYDSSSHKVIRGEIPSNGEVTLVCPGFSVAKNNEGDNTPLFQMALVEG